MNRTDKILLVAYALPTTGLMLQGFLYLTTSRFMPYHADALAARWEDLPANYQGFLLGVLKGMGAGSVAVALAIGILLLVPFRRGEAWARWAVPAVGIVFTVLTTYAAFTIEVRTPAAPPWRQTLGLTAFYLLVAIISYWRRSYPSSRTTERAPCKT